MTCQEWNLIRPFVGFTVPGLIASVPISYGWTALMTNASGQASLSSIWTRAYQAFGYSAVAVLILGCIFALGCHLRSFFAERRLSGGATVVNVISGLSAAGIPLVLYQLRFSASARLQSLALLAGIAGVVSAIIESKNRSRPLDPPT